MKVDEIQKPSWYFRQDMGQDLDTLAVSLLAGQEEPIEVYEVDGKWYTVDGWRRISAAFLAGMEKIEVRKYRGKDPLLSALVRAAFDRSHDDFEKGEGFWHWLDERLNPHYGGDAPKDPYSFVASHRRQDSWAELNEELGDPLGELSTKLGSLRAVEHCLDAYRNASNGVRSAVRTGVMAPSTARHIAEGLSKWKPLQDRVVEKCVHDEIGQRGSIKACKVLRKVIREYEDDEEAIDAVLEDDWTRTEAQMLAFVGIYKEVKDHTDEWYDEDPEVKVLLRNFRTMKRDLVELFDGIGDTALIGKFSPKATRFVVDWLRDVANEAVDIADELEEK